MGVFYLLGMTQKGIAVDNNDQLTLSLDLKMAESSLRSAMHVVDKIAKALDHHDDVKTSTYVKAANSGYQIQQAIMRLTQVRSEVDAL